MRPHPPLYHHRSNLRNNDDPDFQTTTLTRPPLGDGGAAGVYLEEFNFGERFKQFDFQVRTVGPDPSPPSTCTTTASAVAPT